MKKLMPVFLAATTALLSGCEYEAPLSEEHSISLDPSILGLWEEVPRHGTNSSPEQILVLPYSDTQYLIQYPVRDDAIYYRGYLINLEGTVCLQLQVIGTDEGPLEEEKDLFHVASYSFEKGSMKVSVLNTDLVGKECKTTETLQKAFLENIDNKDLFTHPGWFRKCE